LFGIAQINDVAIGTGCHFLLPDQKKVAQRKSHPTGASARRKRRADALAAGQRRAASETRAFALRQALAVIPSLAARLGAPEGGFAPF